jgi:hypothetical protein
MKRIIKNIKEFRPSYDESKKMEPGYYYVRELLDASYEIAFLRNSGYGKNKKVTLTFYYNTFDHGMGTHIVFPIDNIQDFIFIGPLELPTVKEFKEEKILQHTTEQGQN